MMLESRKEKLKELLISICPRCSAEQMDVDASYCSYCGLNLDDKRFMTKYCPSCGSMEISYEGSAEDEEKRDFCVWSCTVCETLFWVHPKVFVFRRDRIVS